MKATLLTDGGRREFFILPTGIAILLVWIATAAYGLFTGDWTGATITSPVMLLFGGYVFGVRITKDAVDGTEK